MDINAKHKELLTLILFKLLDKDLINDPSQVAIGMLDLKEQKEFYCYFSSDAFPILNYMHPLLNRENRNSYKRQLRIYEEIDDNPLLRTAAFKAISKDLNGIGRKYEILRLIKIQNSVSSIFFQNCLQKNISQSDKHILPNSLAYIETEPNGKLLVDLEEILFLWGNNPYYQCTFFNYKNSSYDVIYHTIIFCQEKKSHSIAELIKKLMNDCDDLNLLEYIDENYIGYMKNEIAMQPIIIDWFLLIKEQLNTNITSNCNSTTNRDDWKKALQLLNDKQKNVNEINGENLLNIAKSRLPTDFIAKLNNI